MNTAAAKNTAAAVLLIVIAGTASGILRREFGPREPVPLNLRLGGLCRALSDIMWVRVAGRFTFLTRVSSKEAEENYRRLQLAARLNPDNPEPYRYGGLGLSLWGRPDLALAFLKEGLERKGADPELKRMLFLTVALDDHVDSKAAIAVLKPLTSGDFSDPMSRYLTVLRAQKEEQAGLIQDAILTFERLAVSLDVDDSLRSKSLAEIRRLREKATNTNRGETQTR